MSSPALPSSRPTVRDGRRRPLLFESLENRTVLALTSISVAASVATLPFGQPETLTATVTALAGFPAPNGGTVTFLDAGSAIGSADLVNGTATFTTSTLAAGSHNITASFGGFGNYAASRSSVESTGVASTVGSGLSHPAATAVDAAGDLFIADSSNNRVLEIAANGTQTTVGSGLNNPLGVAVDGVGDVFIADTGNNRVVEVKAGGVQTNVGGGFFEPYGVAVDTGGDAFIADTGNNRIIEIKANGTGSLVASGFNFPTGVALDGAGDVFVADFHNNRVVEVTGGPTQPTFGSGLNQPAGVAVDNSGDVFIADFGNNRVVEAKADGTQVTVGSGLLNPTGVSLDSNLDVFISDYGNNRVLEVKAGVPVMITAPPSTPTSIDVAASAATLPFGQPETFTATVTALASVPTGGTVTFLDAGSAIGSASLVNGTATFTTSTLAVGSHTITASYGGTGTYAASRSSVEPTGVSSNVGSGLSRPVRTASDAAGDLFIADSGNNRVLELKADGSQATVGTGIINPLDVAVDGSGDVFIADNGNNRIVEVKADGTQATVGIGFSSPYGVAVDGLGDVFVADYGNNRVVEVTPNGMQTTVGSGLFNPTGVAVDGVGDVFVADFNNNRVVEVMPNGMQTTIGSGLNHPAGVAVDVGGDVFVADFGNNRVLEIKADGTQATVGSGLLNPTGVGLDTNEDVFISDYGNSRVLEVRAGVPVAVTPAPSAHTNISVAASLAILPFGKAETFTATVTALMGVPTGGTVTFLDAGSVIGSAPLINGAATFTTSTLTVGSHTITASFGGNASYAGSRSGVEPTSVVSTVGSGFILPVRTAIDGMGDIFIADSGNSRVVELKADGTQATIGTGLSNPLDVTVDGVGDVFIADAGNSRVIEVKADGTQITIGSGFSRPYGVTVDGLGDVFVADDGAGQVVEVKPNGMQTVIASALNPTGVALDGSGDIFIADIGGNRVLEIKADGTQTTVGSGLNQPAGVAVDGNGDVFVADFGSGRVLEVKADGTQATIASGLLNPTGVALDAGQDVFISDYGNSRVLEVRAGVPVTVTAPTLFVTSFAATSTGASVAFSEPFNLAPLNLYTTAAANLGPADVTLVGASTGPVQGSLIVNATDTGFTFVKTGGVLAPDTYTLTLRSASNGFQDTSGGLLDGNGDGITGDNYTTTFTVAPSSARVVSIPDFARGPGQPVVIPAATGTGLPLTISDGTNVTSISLTITYNPALLTITGASLGSSAPNNSTVNINLSTPGLAILTFASPTTLAAGLDTFANLTASVPNSAPYASKEDLVIGGISLNGGAIAGTDGDGVHVVAYLGDTTGNGGYSGLDASLIARVVANIDTGFAAFPLLDPTIEADIAGRGSLSAQDAAFVAQFVANVPQPRIPALPGVTITKGGPDPLIWLPRDLGAAPGSTLTVPVLFRQTNGSSIGLDSADLAIEFDPSLFTVTGVSLGNVPRGFTLTESYDNATGEIIASARSMSGPIALTPGTQGTLLLIDLTIRPGAAPGAARLNLLAEGRVGSQVLYTALNDGYLTLTPAPSDSDTDPTDGVVTVTDSPAPTPSAPPPATVPNKAGQVTSMPTPIPAPATISNEARPVAGPPPSSPMSPALVDRAIESVRGVTTSAGRGFAVHPDVFSEPDGISPSILVPWTTSDPTPDSTTSDDLLPDPAPRMIKGGNKRDLHLFGTRDKSLSRDVGKSMT